MSGFKVDDMNGGLAGYSIGEVGAAVADAAALGYVDALNRGVVKD